MKITLFFCAGNFAETLGIHKVTEINGVGRRMPASMLCFSIAALGMLGAPFTPGAISKARLSGGARAAACATAPTLPGAGRGAAGRPRRAQTRVRHG